MTQILVTLLIVLVPFFLLFGLAAHFWNEHDRKGAVMYAVVIVAAVLLWQGAWGMAG